MIDTKEPTADISATPDERDSVAQLPFEVEELIKELTKFLDTPYPIPVASRKRATTLRSVKWGVYAFFDYDDEPIYVGQTKENLGTRIRRHLTGFRSDAVAKNILDPFEVCTVRVYPLPQFQDEPKSSMIAKEFLDALEYKVFHDLLARSKFNAVLNEKLPPTPKRAIDMPEFLEQRIASEKVTALRDHPDIRIARRAQTLAGLARGISERKVGLGIRRTLVTQAKRLQWLAERRVAHASDAAEDEGDTDE